MIEIYTDGACRGNPGPGGWGACIEYSDKKIILSGNDPKTTNNKMELTAVLASLQELINNITKNNQIIICSDSKYVLQGITNWIKNWEKNNWKTSGKKLVKNIDLWKELNNCVKNLSKYNDIKWEWVKGHSGNEKNDFVDSLATNEIDLI